MSLIYTINLLRRSNKGDFFHANCAMAVKANGAKFAKLIPNFLCVNLCALCVKKVQIICCIVQIIKIFLICLSMRMALRFDRIHLIQQELEVRICNKCKHENIF